MITAGELTGVILLTKKGREKRMEKRRDAITYRPASGNLEITKCFGYAVLDGRT